MYTCTFYTLGWLPINLGINICIESREMTKKNVASKITMRNDTLKRLSKQFLLMHSFVKFIGMCDYDDILGLPRNILQRTG